MPELRVPANCLSTPEEEAAFFDALPAQIVTLAYPEIYDYVIQIDVPALGDEVLLALLNLFQRHHVPMAQLRVFENFSNSGWFRDPQAWWYAAVFGPAPQADGAHGLLH